MRPHRFHGPWATVVRFIALALIVFACDGSVADAASPEPALLAERVDRRIAERWAAQKVKPSASADDSAFARRLYLDLIGRIPTIAEARSFIDDRASDKRAKLIDQLLASGGHARHWATFWRREWVPQADQPGSTLADELEPWLTGGLRDNTSYDRLVRELLTAPTARAPGGAPQTFLVASEFKPENLAANTTRAFLGVNLDCAQCHNHPFARWTREQFWETAAFFVRSDSGDPAQRELKVAGTSLSVRPRLLTSEAIAWPAAAKPDSGRTVLAEWITRKDNPYFAKNAVNRVWANLFGTGLVEPLDDLSGESPASHPELLDELAKAFADSGFDLKYLITALTHTRVYQLSSAGSESASSDQRLFESAPVRGLTGEQLYDSLRVAAGLPPDRADLDPLNASKARKQFADTFRIERPGSAQRSILQSLSLMNGPLTTELTNPGRSPVLKAIAGAPFLDTKAKVESLFLATLGRMPGADESAPAIKHVERTTDTGQALADLFWALLNSAEFATNH